MDMSLKRKVVTHEDGAKRFRQNGNANVGVITVGSRKSELAVIQTNHIIGKLEEKHPELKFKMNTMETLGDKILNVALPKIGEKSLFTKDLEIALADGRVEFLVHSLKDLPTTLPSEMALAAIIERDSPYDCVIFHPKHKGKLLADLPNKSVIGTSSLRRIAQIQRKHDHLVFENVRGTLNTRLRKLENDDKYDAIILAKAGIDRMNWTEKIGQILDDDETCLYAIGQGAIAVEIQKDNKYMQHLLGELSDIKTLLSCVAERAFMRKLNGGCSTPIGCSTKIENNEMTLRGVVLSADGKDRLDRTVSTKISIDISCKEAEKSYVVSKSGVIVDSLYAYELDKAEKLGERLAVDLIEIGAAELLAEVRAALPFFPVMNIQIPMKN